MDTDALISEICRRVMEKAAALETQEQDTAGPAGELEQDPGKPKILILTEKHGEICHETLENQILAGKYQTECALLKGEDCKAEDYEAILVYTLSNVALGKLAAGIFDCPFTRILGEALLQGKKILAAREGVEINGPRPSKGAPHILNASFLGVRSEVLLHSLEDKGIYVSAGSACSSHKRTGSASLGAIGLSPDRKESAIRFSFSEFTGKEELDYTLGALRELLPMLRRYARK